MGRAPAVDAILRLAQASQLGPGIPASPGVYYLPLLPSGPDGVHSSPPHRTRPSTPLVPCSIKK